MVICTERYSARINLQNRHKTYALQIFELVLMLPQPFDTCSEHYQQISGVEVVMLKTNF